MSALQTEKISKWFSLKLYEEAESLIKSGPFSDFSNSYRLLGPLVGIAHGLILVAASISYLAERVFKGLAHVVGSFICNRFDASFGKKMLSFKQLLRYSIAIGLAPLLLIESIRIHTLNISFNSKAQANVYIGKRIFGLSQDLAKMQQMPLNDGAR